VSTLISKTQNRRRIKAKIRVGNRTADNCIHKGNVARYKHLGRLHGVAHM